MTEFLDFYMAQLRKVTNVVQDLEPDEKPLVFLETAAGWSTDECCKTFGSFNYGRFVELAGGRNYGSTLFTAFSSDVSLEGIIAANPAVIIGTGANWAEARPEVTSTLLGYEGDPEENQTRLEKLAARDGFKDLDAVRNGRFHSIYHQFYNSPFHVVAIQQLAKWIHPDLFEDLDPEATFVELHERFLPFDYSGQFWLSLN